MTIFAVVRFQLFSRTRVVVYQPTKSRSVFLSFYAVLNCSNFFRRHNNKVCYCPYLRQHTNCKVYQRKRHVWDISLLLVFDENIWEDLFVFRLYAMKILRTIELFPIKFTKKIIDEKAFLLHISIVYVNFVTK